MPILLLQKRRSQQVPLLNAMKIGDPLCAEQRSIIEEIATAPMMKTEVTSMPAGMTIVRTTVAEITAHRGLAMIGTTAVIDTTGDRTSTTDRMEAWKMIAEETVLALQGRVLLPLALTPANSQMADSTMVTMVTVAASGTGLAITLAATTFKTNRVKTMDHGVATPTCVEAVAVCIRRAKDLAKSDPDANGVAIMTVCLVDPAPPGCYCSGSITQLAILTIYLYSTRFRERILFARRCVPL